LVPDNDGWDSAAYPKTAALHNYLVDDCGMGPMTYADGVPNGLYLYRAGDSLRGQTGIDADWIFTLPFVGWNLVVDEIDRNKPAMVTTTIQSTLSPEYYFHTMAVDGYKALSDGGQEILVHPGWYSSVSTSNNGIVTEVTEVWVPVGISTYSYKFIAGAGWHDDSTGARRYLGTDGEYYSGWKTIDGNTYYFRPLVNVPSQGQQHSMVTGLQLIDGTDCYFNTVTGIFQPGINNLVTGAATRDAGPALEYLGISGVEESGQ
jgi:hypothetical protein